MGRKWVLGRVGCCREPVKVRGIDEVTGIIWLCQKQVRIGLDVEVARIFSINGLGCVELSQGKVTRGRTYVVFY